MGLDPLSVVAPARVRALLLPVGRITAPKFIEYVSRLQQQNVVRLGDVSPDGRPHRTMFSPLAFPAGLVLYDLSTTLPPSSRLSLSPFELYREPLLVLGVADAGQISSSTTNGLSKSVPEGDGVGLRLNGEGDLYRDLQPEFQKIIDGYPRALVHRILLFDHSMPAGDLPEGLVTIPSPRSSNTTTMKTVMCDLTSQLLADLTTFAKALQALPSIDTPMSGLSGAGFDKAAGGTVYGSDQSQSLSATQGSRSRSPAQHDVNSQNRMSVPVPMPSTSNSRAATPDGRPLSPPGRSQTPPTTFDEIAGVRGTGSPSRSGVNESRRQSRDRVSVQGFGAGGSGEKERIKGKSRVGIVMGSMYLLAGRWPDALKELVESASIARANSDYVWLAKALDCILVTLLMHAWAGMDFKVPQILYPGVDRTSKSSGHKLTDSVSDFSATHSGASSRLVSLQNLTGILPDLINNMINLYVRAWTFTEDKIPALVFSETVVRFSKLLAVVQLSQGYLDDRALQKIVLNETVAKDAGVKALPMSFPSKVDIVTTLFRAFPDPAVDAILSVADRTTILAGIASVLSDLGYHRKKALILKEIVSGLLPALVQARKDGAAEMGVHPATSLVTLSATAGNAASSQSDSRIGDSEYGMRSFLSLLCTEYEVSLSTASSKAPKYDVSQRLDQGTKSPLDSYGEGDNDDQVIARILHQASTHLLGSENIKIDVLRACINICEALPDLEGVLRFSADTLRTAGSGIAPGPDSSDGSPSLSIEDQLRLMNNISRTLSASQQLGYKNMEAEYWDEFLVRGIELADVGSSRVPTPHAKGELELVNASENKAIKNPFIYNPFDKPVAARAEDSTLVADEEVVFRVTLQNLYDFDLEVEKITLETSGAPFDSLPESILVGPYRTQTMTLIGVPRAGGSLKVSGCYVKIKGCRERRFPLFSIPWSLNIDVKTDPRELITISQNAIGDGETKVQTSVVRKPVVSQLQLNVINVQPNVVMRSISLPQSAVMLLEGESKVFSVTLQNLSSAAAADLLSISFKDSTTTQLQSALSNKALTLAELYELELSATRNQSFRWLRTAADPEPTIDPGGSITLEIEVFGKPGLSHGNIQVDFGYLGVPKSEVKDRFYTRQLIIPLTITVNASVELVRNDLIPFPGDFAWQNQQRQQGRSASSSAASTPESQPRHHTRRHTSKDENTFSSLLSRLGLGTDDDEHCLLLLDLRNSWPNLITTSIQVRQNPSKDRPASDLWKRAYTVHETQQPGHTSRLVLILPRLYIPNPHAPIPSLNPATKRQYIVPTSKDAASSPETELAAREAFWYREELLQHIRATWREDSSGRTGTINLRSLRLSTRMMPALRLDDLAISLSLSPCPEIKPLGRATFAVPTSTFLTLTTTLWNRSAAPVHPLLRLQPCLRAQEHADLTKRLLWNGGLQRVLPVLGAGEGREVGLQVCVLSEGEYEVGAWVEEVRRVGGEGEGEEEGDFAMRGRGSGGERRVWYAGEPCVIVAEDGDEGG
ncbi:MAG: hypothetical protein Q9195_007579 [Heterodermia aff. obscurata]